MTQATITAMGLNEALGNGFSFADFLTDNEATLTTEHAASSYGQPVLVRDDKAYGPADLADVTLHLSATSANHADLIAPARAAGWTVQVAAWCAYCAGTLSEAETRRPGDVHPECATTREIIQQSMGNR